MSKKTSPKKKETSPRKGVNKKTKSGKPVRGNMSMILIGILMTLSFVANAQLGNVVCGGVNGVQQGAGAIQPGDYQAENLAAGAKFNAISVTTYTNPGTQYIPNRYTYVNTEWYYLSYADTAGVPTHAPTTVTYPIFLYLCQPGAQASTLQNYPTTSALGGTATSTVKFDTTYTFIAVNGGDSTQVDSVRFHLGLKYNYNSRTVIVNQADGINDKNASGPNQYLHKARVPYVPQVPVY